MKDVVKKAIFLLMAVLMMASTACGYAGITSHNGRLYVAKNCFFGACRAIMVCTEAAGNKLNCQHAGKP